MAPKGDNYVVPSIDNILKVRGKENTMESSSYLSTGELVNKDHKWMCHVVKGAQCKFDLGAVISLRIYPEVLEAEEAGPTKLS